MSKSMEKELKEQAIIQKELIEWIKAKHLTASNAIWIMQKAIKEVEKTAMNREI